MRGLSARSLLPVTVAALVLAAAACQPAAAPFPDGEIVDLSHTYDADTVFWPTAGGFQLEVESAGYTEKGYYYAANNFSTSEHGGTHLDAPIHFAEGAPATDEIPLERLVGPAVVVDVTAACAADADYQIGVDDVQAWEAANGQTVDGMIVLLRTGFAERWPDAERYLGTAERGADAVAKLHFPGLHPDLAAWLVAERDVKAVGLDTASIDYGQSTLYETHQILFKAGIPAFENVANVSGLPARGFSVVALPMKIGGGSGGPLRIIAIVPPG
jgi:kynurenine formamidase